MKDEMRGLVITDAVEIEAAMSHFLAKVLKITADPLEKDLPLVYLPFEHKCLILKDMSVIPRDLFVKLTFFAEIRNKFCHNIRVKTLQDGIGEAGNGRLKKLLQFYPEQLTEANPHQQLFNIY